MEFPLSRGVDYSIIFENEDRFDDVDITSASFGSDDFVIFDSIGTPSEGGSVTLQSGQIVVNIILDSFNGVVTINE